jgi:hypothetical protein
VQGIEATDPAAQRLITDMADLEEELMPLFRDRDHSAKREQNSYRLYQLGYMFLASLATAIGSTQILVIERYKDWIIWIGLAETLVSLFTVFLATLQGTRQPFSEWIQNRKQAEQLRREYFRYLTDAKPYNVMEGARRRRMMALRAAAINDGEDPDSVEEEL